MTYPLLSAFFRAEKYPQLVDSIDRSKRNASQKSLNTAHKYDEENFEVSQRSESEEYDLNVKYYRSPSAPKLNPEQKFLKKKSPTQIDNFVSPKSSLRSFTHKKPQNFVSPPNENNSIERSKSRKKLKTEQTATKSSKTRSNHVQHTEGAPKSQPPPASSS